MESGLALILTQIGAATGFIAFLMKVWEFYYDRRPRLRMERSLTSDPDRGNTITILNSSKVGTSIHYNQLEALPKSRQVGNARFGATKYQIFAGTGKRLIRSGTNHGKCSWTWH